jgi:hypothetical protein
MDQMKERLASIQSKIIHEAHCASDNTSLSQKQLMNKLKSLKNEFEDLVKLCNKGKIYHFRLLLMLSLA